MQGLADCQNNMFFVTTKGKKVYSEIKYSDFDEVFSMQSSMVDHVQDINSLMSILNTQGNTIKSNMNELKSINKSTNLSINTMTSNLEELQGEFTEIAMQVDTIKGVSDKLVHNE